MILFGQIGECKSCKIIYEVLFLLLLLYIYNSLLFSYSLIIIIQPGNDPYAFIEFSDHSSAANALTAMNKRICLGKVSFKCLSSENHTRHTQMEILNQKNKNNLPFFSFFLNQR